MKSPRRKTLIVTAAVCLVTTAAAGTVNFVALRKAEERVVDAATCRLGPAGAVSADLDGPLAGLRALTGDVATVRLRAEGVRRQGTDMDVDAVLKDVSRDGVKAGTGTATVGYPALNRRADEAADGAASGLVLGTDGKDLTLTGNAGDTGLPVTVRTTLSTTADSVTVTPAALRIFGRDVPVDRLASLPFGSGIADKLKPRTIGLGDLPDGVELTGARATGSGLVLSFALNGALDRTAGTGHCVGTTA
ncbi:LmeA family phospholipid-binding protein [Streptomyces sp. NPDC006512]|uniref:LmeA family phospholipid-binding protein n=1 Tax=Streptomyces sp. NPDC006512 TaxID=3154307 RepID=UPI0033A7B9DC